MKALAALLWVAALTGCRTAPTTFRLIDDETEAPLEDVRARVYLSKDYFPFGIGRSRDFDLLRSDSDGIVRAPSLEKWDQLFLFYKEGYSQGEATRFGPDWQQVIGTGAHKAGFFGPSEVVVIHMRPLGRRYAHPPYHVQI
jgi:hypothetical protein